MGEIEMIEMGVRLTVQGERSKEGIKCKEEGKVR